MNGQNEGECEENTPEEGEKTKGFENSCESVGEEGKERFENSGESTGGRRKEGRKDSNEGRQKEIKKISSATSNVYHSAAILLRLE